MKLPKVPSPEFVATNGGLNMPKNLHEEILKFFVDRPGKIFSFSELGAEFKKVIPATLRYHLKALNDQGAVSKPGFNQYSLNSAYKSMEDLRKEIAERATITVKPGGQAWDPKHPIITASESSGRFKRHLLSITKRMKMNPTIFTDEDIEAISELSSMAFGEPDQGT